MPDCQSMSVRERRILSEGIRQTLQDVYTALHTVEVRDSKPILMLFIWWTEKNPKHKLLEGIKTVPATLVTSLPAVKEDTHAFCAAFYLSLGFQSISLPGAARILRCFTSEFSDFIFYFSAAFSPKPICFSSPTAAQLANSSHK